MRATEVLLQGEGIPGIQPVRVGNEEGVKDLLEVAAECRTEEIEGDFCVFLEGSAEPISVGEKLPESKDRQPLSVQVHRCSRISVGVIFRAVIKQFEFSPARRVGDAEKIAATRGFGLNPDGYEFKFAGTEERPDPLTQIGALVSFPDCSVSFDLVSRR